MVLESFVKRETSEYGDNILKVIDFVKHNVVKVGWPKAIRYPRQEIEKKIASENGKFKKQNYSHPASSSPGELVATVAAKNELGAGVPARPFMRPTIANKKNEWFKLVDKLTKDAINGKRQPRDIFEGLAITSQEDMKATIKQILSPPLSPVTIQRRVAKYKNKSKIGGLDKPLIDTSYMLTTLTGVVTKE